MALKSALSFMTRKISKAVEEAAAKQSLARSDYALVGSLDERTDRISLTLGTDHPIDDRRLYADIFAGVRRMFPDQPHITMQIGLVIRKVRNLDEVYLDNVFADDELDLTELLERA
jgi:hypothetical protein